MTRRDVTFDPTRIRTVSLIEEPDLFEIATASLDGDGIFSYQGQLWQVGENANAERLEISPEKQE